MSAPPVWITGLAWTTALGAGADRVWRALLEGRTGIGPVPSPHPLRNTAAAAVPGLPAEPARRQHVLAADTLRSALADAGLVPADPRLHAVLGTSYGAHADTTGVSTMDTWARDVTAELGMARPPVVVSTACSSGSDSVLLAAELITAGEAEICVCGGSDVLTDAKRLGHSALGTMSPTSLRAFDTRHDGTLLGEGAGFLVLESADSARARGARPRAAVVGAGSANDAASPAAPDLSGGSVVLAVERALRAAGREAADVGVVNAHGSGTPVNDAVEATSFTELFPTAPPVGFATKGAFGHTLGATGALEAIAVVLALRDRVVPPVHGTEHVLPGFPLPLPIGGTTRVRDGLGMSVTLGFGGFNTCLLLEGVPWT
ncbi:MULTISPECIES: beta-ketoacyl synthase N-terminal-like domain-containing protein [Actinosynnema]|uniref:beta-ketoacyl synthase N-terminal-like domain-containing protein n=1 Tax=Actinosynnema TaxID=40566 RepID=UPI0020A53914|nr:beta-ketoacyl synthase N-terminal-like domain-containing protein [Actinosynnema pretiosum]